MLLNEDAWNATIPTDWKLCCTSSSAVLNKIAKIYLLEVVICENNEWLSHKPMNLPFIFLFVHIYFFLDAISTRRTAKQHNSLLCKSDKGRQTFIILHIFIIFTQIYLRIESL